MSAIGMSSNTLHLSLFNSESKIYQLGYLCIFMQLLNRKEGKIAWNDNIDNEFSF